MSCKLVVLSQRKDDMSHEECIEYMEKNHIPLAKDLPGLKKYTTSIPLNPDEVGYDGIAQLWFESPEEMNAALESPTGQRVQEDAANFVKEDETQMVPVADETVRMDET